MRFVLFSSAKIRGILGVAKGFWRLVKKKVTFAKLAKKLARFTPLMPPKTQWQ